jgi:dTDP-4-dehydrorhamnose reductase
MLWRDLPNAGFDVFATLRKPNTVVRGGGVIAPVFAERDEDLTRAIDLSRPDCIINCIGVIKQAATASDPETIIRGNAVLPHVLSRLAASARARLIHISTDCVFSGAKGQYKEEDAADATDMYGRTKLLGEVRGPGLTIRTSIIGRELSTRHGLVEWFLSGSRTIRGYAKAIYTGFTTREFVRVLSSIMLEHRQLDGVLHVSSEPISKYDLLLLLKHHYSTEATIERDDGFECDRSLDSTKFRGLTGYAPPSWNEMIREMREDPFDYDRK